MMIRRLFITLAACFALCAAEAPARAAAAPAGKPGGNVEFPHYKDTASGRVLDAIFRGSNAVYLPDGAVQVKGFRMTGARDGQATNVSVTALAPECRIDYNRKIAGDPGPVQIFTPATNMFVQGVGFFCAESNQILFLSNQVETRVVKSMLQSSPLFASGTPSGAAQIVKIFSDRGQFDFSSNLVDYAGGVRVIDPQYQLDAPLLSIQFASNQTVETMFARQGVTLTLPGKGAATGATAHYFATNENVLLELAGDADAPAHWQNGEQEARAARFTYDPNRHVLTGNDHARIRWPNQAAGQPAPHTFLELFADDAAVQLSTNGQDVERLTAAGNVIIANQADQSSALAGKVYDRTNDLFVLTDDPSWWNDPMEVRGETLSMSPSNKVYRAQQNARLKLRVSGSPGGAPASTNQWLIITADDMLSQPIDSQTNLVTFRGDVQARLLEGEALQDTLTSKTLLVWQASGPDFSNQVVRVVARGGVRLETVPDARGVKKTISCGVLTANRSATTGLLQTVVAEEAPVLESFGSGSAAVSNRLSAALVTAHFSAVTNQLENALAEGAVDFIQTAPGKFIHATGGWGLYTVAPDEQVELTGHPWAQTDKLTLLDADRLAYNARSGAVGGSGRYHIVFPEKNTANPPPPAPPAP
jgi:lipopolysaccharide export system protein LptA